MADTEKPPEYAQPPPTAPYPQAPAGSYQQAPAGQYQQAPAGPYLQQPMPGFYQQPNTVGPMAMPMTQMQNSTTVFVNQAGPVSSLPYPQNVREFSTGLCGCCSDIGGCKY